VGEVLTHQLQIEVREYTLYRHVYQPHRERSCPAVVGEVLTHQLHMEVREYTKYNACTCPRTKTTSDILLLDSLKYAGCAAEAIFCCPTENSHHLKA
jgi:hypothetical protein